MVELQLLSTGHLFIIFKMRSYLQNTKKHCLMLGELDFCFYAPGIYVKQSQLTMG